MTAALSVYRAFMLEGAWSELTHISAISGSSWFLGIAAYSTDFSLKMAMALIPSLSWSLSSEIGRCTPCIAS